MKKFVKYSLCCVLVLALAGAVGYRLLKPAEPVETASLPTVSLGRAEAADLQREVALMGQIQAADSYYVIPKTVGEIIELKVQNGAYVKKGDLLCRIDNSKQIDAARIQMEGARVSYQTAQAAFERVSALYAAGDVAAQNYEQARAQAEGAKYQYEAAQLQYETQLEFGSVTAPADGIVQSSSMSLHGMASQQTPLCVIAAEGARQLVFQLTDSVRSKLEPGVSVRVEKDGKSYAGSISELDSRLNPQSGMYSGKAVLEQAEGLADGSSCKFYLVTDKVSQALSLPLDLIYYAGGQPYVYTYSEGTVHRAELKLGVSDGKRVQVLEGISASDRLVMSWSRELYDGAKVLTEDGQGA